MPRKGKSKSERYWRYKKKDDINKLRFPQQKQTFAPQVHTSSTSELPQQSTDRSLLQSDNTSPSKIQSTCESLSEIQSTSKSTRKDNSTKTCTSMTKSTSKFPSKIQSSSTSLSKSQTSNVSTSTVQSQIRSDSAVISSAQGQTTSTSTLEKQISWRPLFNGDLLAILAGVPNSLIGDEIIMAAIELLKFYDTSSTFEVAALTPAEFEVQIHSNVKSKHPLITTLKPAINFHFLEHHWMTSYFNPATGLLSVYDSLSTTAHRNKIKPQLRLLYGEHLSNNVLYPPVTQQQSDPTCGIFSIAFAFSVFLNIPPDSVQFNPHVVRTHLQYCLKHKVICQFPTYDYTSSLDAAYTNQITQKVSVYKHCSEDTKTRYNERRNAKRRLNRENPMYRQEENMKRNAQRSRKRQEYEYRINEILNRNQSRSKKRKDDEYKMKENTRKNQTRTQRRIDDKYKMKEYASKNQARSKQRKDDEYKMKENTRRNDTRSQKRKDDEYKVKENTRRNRTRSQKRKDDEYKVKEYASNNQARSKQRKDDEYKMKENKRRNQTRSQKRTDDEYKVKEYASNNQARSKQRKDDEYKMKENKRRNQTRSQKRTDDEYKVKEYASNNQARSKQRKDDEYKVKENTRRNETRSQKRKDDEYKVKEYASKNQARSKQRKVDEYKMKENTNRNRTRAEKRSEKKYRMNENSKRIKKTQRKRSDLKYRISENLKRKQMRKKKTMLIKKQDSLQGKAQNFVDLLKRGDAFVCTCCNQTFFQHSVYLVIHKNFQKKKIPSELLHKCLTGCVSCCNAEWICKTCYKYLNESKMPPMATANGFQFPVQPGVITDCQPTATEERCTALRIPFMQIKQLGVGKQYGIFGSTVNVPMNPTTIINSLPRRFDNTSTIQLQFKRRSVYKSAYIYETVRPKVIFNLTKYFVDNSELYKEEGITLNSEWIHEVGEAEEVDYKVCNEEVADKTELVDEDDDWTEVGQEELYTAGNRDTLLQNMDFTDDGKHAIQVAPGEKNHPLSLYMDTFAEEKAFPVLFAGQKRPSNDQRQVQVKYSTICKAELRHSDRRFANNTANIFFKLKKLQTLQVRDITMTALRKTKGNNLTAGELKQPGAIENMLRHDDGFNILKTLRSSPPYFRAKQKELFAMINQLGLPTFFVTFSAAETKWNDLLLHLANKQNIDKCTTETVQNMTWIQKSELIQKDPVTCARFFHYRSDLFLNNILLTPQSPIGELKDYFIRVEFQQRGSPHLHTLFWIEDAPVFGTSSEKKVIEFIDKNITCSSVSSDEQLRDLLKLQQHSHTKSCKIRNKRECRFGFPIPPMVSTCILEPLPADTSKTELKMHKDNFSCVQNVLNLLPRGETMLHEEFLGKCKLDNNQYILAVRSSLDKTKVFLKRNVVDVRTNNYNPDILKIWKANTDIQFVLDPWAVCAYIASYMMKSQRGMGLLLQEACREAKAGNHSVRKRMQIISNKFLNHCEISAQEAVYLLLQMPLTRSSRQVHFVNTSPPEQRIQLLKPTYILNSLPNDSTEVTCSGLIERYANRPKIFQNITLAEFAAWFDRSYKKSKSTKEQDQIIDTIDSVEDDLPNGYEIQLPDGQKLVKRCKPKILRYVKYSVDKDPENYYREQLLLFHPWTEEHNLLHDRPSFKSRYEELQEKIQAIQNNFDKYGDTISNIYDELQEEQIDNAMDTVAPVSRQTEEEAILSSGDAINMLLLQPQTPGHMSHDIAIDMGIGPITPLNEMIIKNRITNDEFYSLMRSLNSEQRIVFDHILHLVKTQSQPFHIFLSGGAGVGKSHVLKSIYQGLLRFFDTEPGQNPDDIKVAIGATTGKAAFNVKGNTLHSLFNIPANHSLSTYTNLDHSKLNTLRCQFSALKVLIIDEISMMGCKFFNFINNRLKEIFGTDKFFGGISLLLVGDLFQLRPVMDQWIFQNTDVGYGPLTPNIWEDLVYLFELKTVMRQKNDADFAHLLNRIREDKHTVTDIDKLATREITNNTQPHQKETILHLFATNQQVDNHNHQCLENIKEPGCLSFAKDYAIGEVAQSVRSKILDIAKELPPQKTQNLQNILQIKISAPYMLTHNIDTSDGLTNGATCIVKTFKLADGKPNIVWVQFEDEDIGNALRQKYKCAYTQEIKKNWVPLQQIDRQFQVGKYKAILLVRKQFPLKAASAITIHKSQGISLRQAVVSFKGRIPAHMVYVALSRVTSLCGLFITDFDKSKIKIDSQVKTEMERLRTTKILQIKQIVPVSENKLLVMCHNTRSLHAHITDVHQDHHTSLPDILILQETWELPQDGDLVYTIPPFTNMKKILAHNSGTRPHAGTRIYIKPTTTILSSTEDTHAGFEILSLHLCDQNNRTFQIVSVYKHARTDPKLLLRHLETIVFSQNNLIVIGDFNIDLKKSNQKPFAKEMFDRFNLTQMLDEETTDYHSQIDHIYTTNTDCQFGALESYWSDHKRIWIIL